MRLIDADLLKEKMLEGKIVIDEDVLKCDSIHSQLVYLLEKVEKFMEETIDNQPTAYDVKKVVEDIKDYSRRTYNEIAPLQVINIVRRGGRE